MNDKAAIDELAARFYALFTTRNGSSATVEQIHDLFIPQGVIVKTCGEMPVVYDLQGFIEPRAVIARGRTGRFRRARTC